MATLTTKRHRCIGYVLVRAAGGMKRQVAMALIKGTHHKILPIKNKPPSITHQKPPKFHNLTLTNIPTIFAYFNA